MKIFLDNYDGHITLKRMLPYWQKMGVSVSTDPKESQVHLANVRFSIRTSLPKALRLDSIYYDSATNYNDRNKEISTSHSKADGIIYQSLYSKRLIESYLTPRKKDAKWSVIYNGIEPDWCGNFIPHKGINITIIGKHRRHKRLKEIIEIFIEFLKSYSDTNLHIFGRLHDNKEVCHSRIKYYGHVDREKMFEQLRKTDMSLHLSKRDCAPNSVVEYLSAGIPVITTNNCGGATEMCHIPGCIIVDGDGSYDDLAPVSHYGEQWNVLPDQVFKDIVNAMCLIAEDKRRVVLPDKLHIEHMAESYVKLMKEII